MTPKKVWGCSWVFWVEGLGEGSGFGREYESGRTGDWEGGGRRALQIDWVDEDWQGSENETSKLNLSLRIEGRESGWVDRKMERKEGSERSRERRRWWWGDRERRGIGRESNVPTTWGSREGKSWNGVERWAWKIFGKTGMPKWWNFFFLRNCFYWLQR